MTVLSGRYGLVTDNANTPNAIAEITKWSYTKSADDKSYAGGSTGGYKVALLGPITLKGTLEGKYDENDPVLDTLDVGTEIVLRLYKQSRVAGVRDGIYDKIPAQIMSIQHDVDIDGGDQGWSIEFMFKPITGHLVATYDNVEAMGS